MKNDVFNHNKTLLPLNYPSHESDIILYLQQIIAEQQAVINKMSKQIEKMTIRITELEAQINKNSNNSSKPPSSDGLHKQNRSLREKSNKKQGGQRGHKGSNLPMTDKPDQVFVISATICDKCNALLSDSDIVKKHAPRQVKDIKKPEWIITEYRGEDKQCSCCNHITSAEFPVGVKTHIQYGPTFSSWLLYLHQFQHLPYARLQDAVKELLGQQISTGTITTMVQKFSKSVQPTIESVREYLTKAPVIGADETGMRVEQKLYWFHVLCDKLATLFQVHKRRGTVAIDANGIIPSLTGTLVHDCYASYDRYTNCKHSICNAHILRELIGIAEQTGQDWPNRMIEVLISGKDYVNYLKDRNYQCMEHLQIEELEAGYDEIVRVALDANPSLQDYCKHKRGRVKKTPAQNLIARLVRYKSNILRYIRDFSVPFDNNMAERDIRPVKLRQKISGCFRSKLHAEAFAIIRSFMSTVRKHGLSVYAEIVSALKGEPFLVTG